MNRKIDLHMHTNYSDGRMSPKELMDLCRKHKYLDIAITDHDDIGGYLSAKKLAQVYGINLIPGLEISSNYEGQEVHILAYHFDYDNKVLIELLNYIKNSRMERGAEIVENLQDAGVKLNFKELADNTGESGILGRMHIARAIMQQFPKLTINHIFDKYLGEKSPYYVPKTTPNYDEVIPMIHKADGIAIIAHPHLLNNISIVYGLIDANLDGIEVYCPKAANYYVNLFEELVKQRGLLATGGSDFHGEPTDIEHFGKYSAPESCLKELNNFKMKVNHYSLCGNDTKQN